MAQGVFFGQAVGMGEAAGVADQLGSLKICANEVVKALEYQLLAGLAHGAEIAQVNIAF